MNFRIVEGLYADESCFGEFEKDYLNPEMTIKQMREKYSPIITKKMFSEWIRQIHKKHNLTRKPTVAKYYSEERGGYYIRKNINGKTTYLGRIKRDKGIEVLNRAIQACKDLEWDVDKCKQMIKELNQ